MAMTIPMSRYYRFVYDKTKGTRWGQQFYEFMDLHKVTNPFDKAWCDGMYNASTHIGRQMVLANIDREN